MERTSCCDERVRSMWSGSPSISPFNRSLAGTAPPVFSISFLPTPPCLPSHASRSLTHLFSSPNLAGSAPPGQREAWGSAHASPVLPADDQYQPAFGGAYGPAAIPSSGPGTR